jgi:hypothetical protein
MDMPDERRELKAILEAIAVVAVVVVASELALGVSLGTSNSSPFL